jgi:tetratricopeptide (TPR) repeat protein
MTPEELGLTQNDTTKDIMVSGKCVGNILEQCAVGIEVCRSLSYDNISAENMQTASQILATYIPILQSLQCIGRTAPLLAQIFQIRCGNSYHLEDKEATLAYGEEAVRYARLANDANLLAATLHELAGIHQWPLPGLCLQQRHRKALEIGEEMIRVAVPLNMQAWHHAGYARFQAMNGLKQDAYTSLGKANEALGRDNLYYPDNLYYKRKWTTPVELIAVIRHAAIAYSYLGEQSKAVSEFLKIVTISDSNVELATTMSDRMRVCLLSETLYSTLRLPMPKKDKDLSVILWKASLAKALELRSTTYFNEAQMNLHTMECIWPDDAEITDLRDLLVPWE